MAQKPVYVLNGPNLNLLGQREPHIYGHTTLAALETMVKTRAAELGVNVDFKQTNHEGEMIEWIHAARHGASGIVINAGAWTHTSVALLDALKAFEKPIVEVHLSNPYAREEFRHKSYVSLAARGVICGFGPAGYVFAIEAIASLVNSASATAS